ncbi:glycerophosphodiester phosphodiesterase family protein [Erythrobacter sp. KY5]|uniref:glycerophosphodiester phosphodiesterase family protein n=1 Tax=Erythrobacter sp. KY5 TaxID=2011159 RepID=UPI0013A6D577|nr:glycerophosphodiester phosphodiesterase family protein [Erythrobacter sp. KY5]
MIVWKPLVAALAIAALALPAHGQSDDGGWRIVPANGLSAMVDCHEENGRTLISAHRGGPSPGLPENAIETMDAVLTAIPAIMEVDVARSPDGVHYLMHDRTLDRTTTGTGAVTDVAWSEVEQLRLVDEAGWVTPYRVPTLRAALEWAKGRTVLQIDFKRTADYAEVIGLVRETASEGNVILIAYSLDAANRMLELWPEAPLSLSLSDLGELDAARAAGIPDANIIAFTGTRIPRPDLYSQLDGEDIEVIFGTLGRSPNSIDNVIDRFGTDERYAELSQGGVDILATDRPREAAAALAEAGRLPQAGSCGVIRGEG